MRMRKKPNLVPRMEKCGQVQIKEPEKLRGAWREMLPDAAELWLEIGCGKGRFTLGTAQGEPEVMLLALERVELSLIHI